MERNTESDQLVRADLERAGMSRLELIKRGGLTALMLSGIPAFLAACGGDGEEGAASPSATTSAESPPSTEAAAPAAASGTIDFLSWEGYDLPEVMAEWKQANGIEVNSTYITSHDDIQAKILAGGGEGLDLITYGPHYAAYYRELGIIPPLDESKLPNLANLLSFFASDVENAWIAPDGTRTGAPFTWGALGIGYDSNVIAEPQSYDDLFDPAYKGKLGVPDDPSGNYAFAANVLGLNVSTMTEEDFQTITDYLRELLTQTRGIAPDMAAQYVSGEIVISFNHWAAYKKFAEDAGKAGIETTWPDEPGGYTFVDAWAIPPDSDNPDAAYAWINQTLDPVANAAAAEALVGGVTVEGAEELLPDWLAGIFPYDNLEEFFARAPLQNNPPLESDEYVTFDRMLEAWQELKAGA